MNFHLIKTKDGFYPADQDSLEKANKISMDEVVQAKSIDQRNYEFHKKYFALINIAWQNLPEKFDGYFGTSDDLRKELTKLAGFYHERKDFHGNTIKEPESIAFDNMSPERFEKLYDKTIDLVSRLLNTDNPTLEREILDFI